MADLVDGLRTAVTDRAELPGMSLMEHLAELRKRLIHSVVYLLIGFIVAYIFHERLYGIIQSPSTTSTSRSTSPTPPTASIFISRPPSSAAPSSPVRSSSIRSGSSSPPACTSTRSVTSCPSWQRPSGLFAAGAFFGYHWVLPGALDVLINGFGKRFHPILTIDDYTGFFLAVILGLGICFELPILIFFLALFGIVDAKFLLKHFRYAVLVIFLISAIICPIPDPLSMCLFARPCSPSTSWAWAWPTSSTQPAAKPARPNPHDSLSSNNDVSS